MNKLSVISGTVLCLILLSCHDGSRHEATLRWADSLNRNYIEILSDSQLLEAVDYYDRFGTSNERMRAHYLLGCAYRDMGEAPKALECYHDAADCADTLSSECDYALLSKVYGQSSYLFQEQMTPIQSLEALNLAARYAKLSKDTILYVTYIALRANVYDDLGQADSVISICERVSSMYRQNGKMVESAYSISPAIRRLIERRDYKRAKTYIDYYEKYTQILTASDAEAKLHSTYFYVKGSYYLGVGKLDSAVQCFRRELSLAENWNDRRNAYTGLAQVFHKQGLSDSIVKYTLYMSAATDSFQLSLVTAEMQRMHELYNYNRKQYLVDKSEKKASRFKFQFLLAIFLSILAVISLLWWIHSVRCRHRHRIELIMQKHADEIYYLQTKDEKTMEELRHRLDVTQSLKQIIKKDSLSIAEDNTAMIFQQKGTNKLYRELSPEDWMRLEELFDMRLPGFRRFLLNHNANLSKQEYQICLLVRLGIRPKEMCNILKVSSQTLSNLRSRLLHKLFKIDGGAKDFDNMLCNLG